MATPQRVKKNDEKDYADIYQENFIAQNDPSKLGQQAFNRQLGQGVKKRIGTDRLAANEAPMRTPGVKPPTPGSPFGIAGQAERGSFSPSQGMASNTRMTGALASNERQVGPTRKPAVAGQSMPGLQQVAERQLGKFETGSGPYVPDPNANFTPQGSLPTMSSGTPRDLQQRMVRQTQMNRNALGQPIVSDRLGSSADDAFLRPEFQSGYTGNINERRKVGAGMLGQQTGPGLPGYGRESLRNPNPTGTPGQQNTFRPDIQLGANEQGYIADPNANFTPQGSLSVDSPSTSGIDLEQRVREANQRRNAQLRAQGAPGLDESRLGTSANDVTIGEEFRPGYRGNIPSLEKVGGLGRLDQGRGSTRTRKPEVLQDTSRLEQDTNTAPVVETPEEQTYMERIFGDTSTGSPFVDFVQNEALAAGGVAAAGLLAPGALGMAVGNIVTDAMGRLRDEAGNFVNELGQIISETNIPGDGSRSSRYGFDPDAMRQSIDNFNAQVREDELLGSGGATQRAGYSQGDPIQAQIDKERRDEFLRKGDFGGTDMSGDLGFASGMPSLDSVGQPTAPIEKPKTKEQITQDTQAEVGEVIPDYDAGSGEGQTGGPSEPSVPMVGGGHTPQTVQQSAEVISTGAGQREQQVLDQLDAEANMVQQQFNQQYNRFMQLAISRGAVRGDLESQGFTGGIGQQIRDYLSAGEIQQLGQLMSARDAALKDIDLQRPNAKMIGMQNYLAELNLSAQTFQAQTEFAQTLSQMAALGQITMEEAEEIAEEQGLPNPKELFENAVKAQILSGQITKDQAIEQAEASGLDSGFLTGSDVEFTSDDFTSNELGQNFEESLDAFLKGGEFDYTGSGEVKVGKAANFGTLYLAGAGAGALAGAKWGGALGTALGPGAGTAVGAVAGAIIGGLFGLLAGSGVEYGKDDRNKLINNLTSNTEFVEKYANKVFSKGFNKMEVKKPIGQAGYSATYSISVDGGDYVNMTGTQILTMAISLKNQGYTTDPKYNSLFAAAKSIYEEGRKNAFVGAWTGDMGFHLKNMYEMTFKPE
jgi:hypothetical protein